MTLVTTTQLVEAALATLVEHHDRHLAALERAEGLAPQTIERMKAPRRLAGENLSLASDIYPLALVGIVGLSEEPEAGTSDRMTGGTRLGFTWTLAVEVLVTGAGRDDTLKRCDWYTLTVAECLLRRLPRASDPVDSLRLVDVEFVSDSETQQTLAKGRLLFDLTVDKALDVTAPLEVPDDDLEPYEPAATFPAVQTAHTTTVKEPLP